MLFVSLWATSSNRAPPNIVDLWLEVACGPAAVGRTLARQVGSVHGVDLTPAMIEKAKDGWLRRSSGGPAAAPLIDRLLAEAPASAESFRVLGEGDERRLALRISLTRWRRV